MKVVSDTSYDYIIAGAGCAGLSLAIGLKMSNLPFKKVLITDREIKNSNDRTWCYWSKSKTTWYDGIALKTWSKFIFRSKNTEIQSVLAPYSYHLIRGKDFYDYCFNELRNDSRFEFLVSDLKSLGTEGNKAFVETSSGTFIAEMVFNSVIRHPKIEPNHVNFVQHFKGWLIQSSVDLFNPDEPVFMDFSVDQKNDCRFVYVLPYSKTKALVEYTGFSPSAIEDAEYDAELTKYMTMLAPESAWEILETEKGIIPMYESPFVNTHGKQVINIGTAGGASKASTGFTFYFIQKQSAEIVNALLKGKHPKNSYTKSSRFHWFDKVLLHVMNEKKISAREVFKHLFERNKIHDLLSFLNEESTPLQDLRIMNSVSWRHFIPAALKKLT